jgi:hypothetical protein
MLYLSTYPSPPPSFLSSLPPLAQVLDQVVVKKLRQLTRTFVTLSLEDIAQHAGCATAAAAERLIVDQVAQGKIFAAVDEVTGMVHFSEDKPDEEFG